jgi:ComF family protein
VNRWTRSVLDGLVPGLCLLCHGETPEGGGVCQACRAGLPHMGASCVLCGAGMPAAGVCGQCLLSPPPLARTVVALQYAGTARHLVQLLKFRQRLPVARVLGEALAGAVGASPEGGGTTLIVPVPLHRARLEGRGFNQAREIARVVSARLGVALAVPGTCERQRATAAQSGLEGVATRRRNVAGAFRVRGDVRGERVAIVDDVMTTGATAQELARTLRTAGAREVQAWVCCRVAGPGSG